MAKLCRPLLALALAALPALALAEDDKDLVFAGFDYPVSFEVKADKVGKVCYETRFSEDPAKDYDTVLLQGLMPDPALRLDIVGKSKSFFSANTRYRQDGFRRFPNGRFWARYRASEPTRQPLKVSVTDLGLKGDFPLVLYGTELLLADKMREGEAAASTEPYRPEPDLFVPPGVPFNLVRRADWQAAPPKEPYTRHAPYSFTLHHTQAHYPKSHADAVTEMQFIQDFHQNGRGWIDIGYHFLIDPAGTIFEGRPIGVLGAHVSGHNTGNVGISIMGNYHPPASNVFTPATQTSFVTLGRYVRDTYSVQVSSFYAHRDIGNSDCPGDDLYARKGMLRDIIFAPAPLDENLSPGNPVPTPAQAESLLRLYRRLNGR